MAAATQNRPVKGEHYRSNRGFYVFLQLVAFIDRHPFTNKFCGSGSQADSPHCANFSKNDPTPVGFAEK
jgi:hypothetical protein